MFPLRSLVRLRLFAGLLFARSPAQFARSLVRLAHGPSTRPIYYARSIQMSHVLFIAMSDWKKRETVAILSGKRARQPSKKVRQEEEEDDTPPTTTTTTTTSKRKSLPSANKSKKNKNTKTAATEHGGEDTLVLSNVDNEGLSGEDTADVAGMMEPVAEVDSTASVARGGEVASCSTGCCDSDHERACSCG